MIGGNGTWVGVTRGEFGVVNTNVLFKNTVKVL